MQTHYSSSQLASLDYYHNFQNSYSTISDQYFATTGPDNFSGSFSRGSSSLTYPHEDYRFLTDRDRGTHSNASGGDLSSTSFVTTPTTTSIAFDATGLEFTENTLVAPTTAPVPQAVSGRNYCHPEEIPAHYDQHQGWQWESQTMRQGTIHHPSTTTHLYPLSRFHAHAPMLPQLPPTCTSATLPPDHTFLDLTTTIKAGGGGPPTMGSQSQSQSSYPVRSPTAQLPTPAAMAVLLNPTGGRRREQAPQIAMETALSVVQQQQPMIQMPPSVADVTAVMPVPDILSREKKHACTMCHKRFDRPSTLRKHLLVHTGEKAFVCDTCGRRFGVASNLNRHVRRCILKPANVTPPLTGSGPGSPSTGGSMTPSGPPPVVAVVVDQDKRKVNNATAKRGRALSSTGSTSSSSSSSSIQTPDKETTTTVQKQKRQQPGQKRRRRAPSPSLWVPWSLRTFNLACDEYHRSTPVPLPPVRRHLPGEERDSWDENISSTPYHPQKWNGILPGPGLGLGLGLGGKDVRNINFGGSGGIMLGRVLVF